MRDQYAGDLSDLLKFSLIRAIAAEGSLLGVAWYYNGEHDARYQDGRHREYCDEPNWEPLDQELIKALKHFSERSVAVLEQLPIWPPGTVFHRVPVPSGNRAQWAAGVRTTLQKADTVFFDPDNGVGRASKRHATIDELKGMLRPGRSLIVIKFPGRQNYDIQIKEHHRLLLKGTKAESVLTIRTSVSVQVRNKSGRLQRVPRTRWFTVLNADDAMIARARLFTERLNGIANCRADFIRALPKS